MNLQKVTPWFIALMIGIILIYDIVAAIFGGGSHSTISYYFWTETHKEPLLAFFGGALVIHLFFHDHN